jgi:hypothetical protein
MQKRLELPDRRSRPHPVNRLSRLGVCQCLGGLVLLVLLSITALADGQARSVRRGPITYISPIGSSIG